jgi:5-methylcytosine-specific restriction endonuclease McrA
MILPTDYYATEEPTDPEDQEPDPDPEYKGYKDRYTGYHGTDWESIRQRVLERDDNQCQRCGISHQEHQERDDLFPPDGGLHVHHQVKAKEFESRQAANSLDNLQALCAPCHRQVEQNT